MINENDKIFTGNTPLSDWHEIRHTIGYDRHSALSRFLFEFRPGVELALENLIEHRFVR